MAAPPKLVEGEDYYLEGGLMVFTAQYLLRRGYCCNSGCRHCPYGDEERARAAAAGVRIVLPDPKR
jgi:hypothetical protein